MWRNESHLQWHRLKREHPKNRIYFGLTTMGAYNFPQASIHVALCLHCYIFPGFDGKSSCFASASLSWRIPAQVWVFEFSRLCPTTHDLFGIVGECLRNVKSDHVWLLTSIDIYWHLLTSIDIYWHLLTSIDIYWHLLTSIDIYWHLLTSIDYSTLFHCHHVSTLPACLSGKILRFVGQKKSEVRVGATVAASTRWCADSQYFTLDDRRTNRNWRHLKA